MGVITTEHLDDSELRSSELAQWGPRVRESLAKTYIERIEALHRTGEYRNDDASWARLKKRAWSEAIETDEVCKAVTAISARRRAARVLADGTPISLHPTKPVSAAFVEMVLRSANANGDLTHLDGSAVNEGEIEHLTDVINDPEQRAALLKPYEGTQELNNAMAEVLIRVRERWESDPEDSMTVSHKTGPTRAGIGSQGRLDTRSTNNPLT